MSAAWDSNLHLMAEWDKAITRCEWCREFGHGWKECVLFRGDMKLFWEHYRMTVNQPTEVDSSLHRALVVFLITLGFLAGVTAAVLVRSL